DLVDHAVDVVWQLVTARADIAIEREQALRAAHHLALGTYGQAERGETVEHDAVRHRTVHALQLANAVGKERQRPLGRDARIELTQAASGRIARIDEGLLARFGLTRVELVELLAVHEHFAAHFEHGR